MKQLPHKVFVLASLTPCAAVGATSVTARTNSVAGKRDTHAAILQVELSGTLGEINLKTITPGRYRHDR